MTASLPAILQPSPRTNGAQGRSGTAPEGDAQGFGKLLKSAGSGPKNQTFAPQGAKTGTDTRTARLSLDVDAANGALSVLSDSAEASSDPVEAEESPAGGADEADAPDGAETLLPLLTSVELRDTNRPPPGNPGPLPGAIDDEAASLAGKEPAPARTVDEARQQQGRVAAIVEQSDPSTPAGRTEAAFGKTLIASLNALATQAPHRTAEGESARTARVADGSSAEPQPAARENAIRHDRSTIVPEAVVRARESRETSDRRPEARTAATDQKTVVVAPSAPAPLSTGTPVLQAIAEASLSTAALRRAAAAEIASHTPPAAMQALKIQLHPVELGKVTANLRIVGEQLSVEIQVETAEAYSKLSSETDAIARALRAHGIAVDEVVLQTPQTQPVTSPRDGGGNFAGTSSDAGRAFSGGTEFGQPGGSGHANKDSGHDNGHETEKISPPEQRTNGSGSGRGVYI